MKPVRASARIILFIVFTSDSPQISNVILKIRTEGFGDAVGHRRESVSSEVLECLEGLHDIAPVLALDQVGPHLGYEHVAIGLRSGEFQQHRPVPLFGESGRLGVAHDGCPVVVGEMVDLVEPACIHATAFAVRVQIDYVLIEFHDVSSSLLKQIADPVDEPASRVGIFLLLLSNSFYDNIISE